MLQVNFHLYSTHSYVQYENDYIEQWYQIISIFTEVLSV